MQMYVMYNDEPVSQLHLCPLPKSESAWLFLIFEK